MRRLHALSVLLLSLGSTESFGQCTFPASAPANLLTYSFEPLVAKDKMALRVTLQLNGGPKGKVKLELPSEWAGQQHAENSITELKALSAETTLADTKSPSEKQLTFPPNTLLRLSYVLVKDWNGALNSATRFRPDLSPEYFHIIGTTSLVHPQLDDFTVVDVHFDWQKLPPAWSVATSFGTDDRCQSFHGMWHEAVNSLFVGGDYRIYRTTVSGNALNFAIRGKWSFTDDQWVGQVRKVMEFERTFWHDNDFPYFLVTLTPFGQERGSSGGTALTNAFMEHLSRLDPLTAGALGGLAHEIFHAWNPGKMGHRPGSDYLVSWFFEGFTRYYQDLMLFRAGLLTFPDYIAGINEKLQKYELSEGTEVSLQEFIRRHTADHSSLNQLDYRRGAVLATWLDATIREKSGNRSSLDNLMFDLVGQEAAYRHSHGGKSLPLTSQRVFRAASKYISGNSRSLLREYVEQGGSIRIPENALGPCVQSHNDTLAKFDLGFDLGFAKGEKKVVAGVEPDTEAYKAGLRNGQQLTELSFNAGDTSKQVRLTIKTADGNQMITYYPQGAKLSVQQFGLDVVRYSSNPGMCVAALQSP